MWDRPSLKPESEEVDAIVFGSATAQRGCRLARILHDDSGSDRLDEALGHDESSESGGLVFARLADLGSHLSETVAAPHQSCRRHASQRQRRSSVLTPGR